MGYPRSDNKIQQYLIMLYEYKGVNARSNGAGIWPTIPCLHQAAIWAMLIEDGSKIDKSHMSKVRHH